MRASAPVFVLLAGCFGLDTLPQKDSLAEDSAVDTGSATAGALVVDRSSVDFGTVEPGDAASEALVLSNTGDGTLRVEVGLTGDAVFSLSDSDVALAAGGDSTLTITFSPSGEMTYGGTTTLTLEDGSSVDISLLGIGGEGGGDNGGENGGDNGGGGSVEFSPSSYDLGEVDIGATSNYTFTIANNSASDVLVDSVTTTDAAFSVSGGTLAVPQVLSAGSSKTIQVTFEPTAERVYSANLVAHTDTTPSQYSAALVGTGADLCSICAPLITVETGADPYSVTDFFSFFGAADARTWTIFNDGDQDLNISSISVNNDFLATCGSFSVSSSGSRTIAAYGSSSFGISYTATSTCLDVPQASLDANVVHIISNDPSQSDYVIEVGGTGLNL